MKSKPDLDLVEILNMCAGRVLGVLAAAGYKDLKLVVLTDRKREGEAGGRDVVIATNMEATEMESREAEVFEGYTGGEVGELH